MHATSTIGAKSLETAATDSINLSGTTGAPNTAIDFAISPDDAALSWEFNADGTIDRNKTQGANVTDFFPGSQWSADTPVEDYWIRFTHNAGDTANIGDASGTWWDLTTLRWQGWQETTNGFANYSGSSKVEIASDSGGSTIVATGYYGGTADVEI